MHCRGAHARGRIAGMMMGADRENATAFAQDHSIMLLTRAKTGFFRACRDGSLHAQVFDRA
jgi:hypothetical protein